MPITVNANVPLPPAGAPRGVVKYPWDAMQHGDSFEIEERYRHAAATSFHNWRSKDPARARLNYRTRKINNTHVRVWLYDPDMI
jgi:hypothetical protein